MEIKTISVEITIEDIQQLLEKHLVIKDKQKFAELIVGHLSKSNIALEQTYKGLLGMYPEFNYKEGDWVYIDISNLTSWRMNKESTLKLPGTLDQCIPCEITGVDIYSAAAYSVNYKYVKKDTMVTSNLEHEEILDETYSVEERYIFKKVENLIDVLDELEELQINNEDISS
jgi:hypothetical protein